MPYFIARKGHILCKSRHVRSCVWRVCVLLAAYMTPSPTLLDAQIAAHIILLSSMYIPRSPLREIFRSTKGSHHLEAFAQNFATFSHVHLYFLRCITKMLLIVGDNIVQTESIPIEPSKLRLTYNRQRVFSTFFGLSLRTRHSSNIAHFLQMRTLLRQ